MKKNPYAEEFAEFITLKELNDGHAWNEWNRFQKDVPSDFEYLKNKQLRNIEENGYEIKLFTDLDDIDIDMEMLDESKLEEEEEDLGYDDEYVDATLINSNQSLHTSKKIWIFIL